MNDEQERRVESRAEELHRQDLAGEDQDEAERAARALLKESDERTQDPATRNPDDPGVVRRKSEETTTPPDLV